MTERDCHDTVVELLPWFVNGTLGEREATLVEEHVHECVRCYSLLQQERRVHSLLGAEPPATISSAVHGFERLRPRLGPDAEPACGRPAGRWRRAEGFALAAGLATIAVTALLWQRFDDAQRDGVGGFETLSEPAAAMSQTVDIVFTPALLETDMRALLRERGAVIVNGPTELGRYTIRLDRAAAEFELDVLVEQLRSDPRVRFVSPSFIDEGSR